MGEKLASGTGIAIIYGGIDDIDDMIQAGHA